MASLIVQVAVPPDRVTSEQVTALPSGSVTVQVIEPLGVIESVPVTVAVKVKLEPVTWPEALSLTAIDEVVLPTVTLSDGRGRRAERLSSPSALAAGVEGP